MHDGGVSTPFSCDTFAVLPDAAAGGRVLFGKNSDRPARECQPLRRIPARSGGGRLRLAYLEIDDAEQTYAHLGSSPYWCWGHEIGMNTQGVVIGNEALFTRDLAAMIATDREAIADDAQRPEPGLLGMELLRLGLERGGTAAEAVEVMINLLERYGQWGAGTVSADRGAAAYDNAYCVADRDQVFLLETSGHDWAVRQVATGTASLSNQPTIRTDWTRLSDGLSDRARTSRWPGAGDRLDFAQAVTDPQTPLQLSHIRLQRSRQLLAGADGVDWNVARAVLSDHYESTFLGGPQFNPARPDFLTLCMHDSPAGFTWGNTAASVIAELATSCWWWAATTPCTSIYLPVAVAGGDLPSGLSRSGTAADTGPNPEQALPDGPAQDSYWWTFQLLLEAVCQDPDGTGYLDRQPAVRAVFDPLQQQFRDEAADLEQRDAGPEAWDTLTRRCADRARAAARDLLREFTAEPAPAP